MKTRSTIENFFTAMLIFACLLTGCKPGAQKLAEDATDARENDRFWHEEHDPYRVYQFSANGDVIHQWVADGKPETIDDHIRFHELGTGYYVEVFRPARYEQAPGAKPE